MRSWLRFLLLFSLLAPSCRQASVRPIVRQTSAMNSFLSISLYDEGLQEKAANAVIDSAFAEVRRIEGMASDYIDTSEIGKINARAGHDSLHASDELAGLLRRSLAYGDSSGGAFDIAVGPDVKLWDFLSEHPRVPPSDSIARLLPLLDQRLVSIHGDMVYLPRPGMALDLGGIAKGYAVERVASLLKRNGLRRFIVDFSGNLAVCWEGTQMLDSTAATIEIRHPRKEGKFLGSFRFGTGGVSTSGDYERCFFENGIRYNHIIDPKTGYPVRGIVSVTIVSDNAESADALSTLVFVLGREKGMAFIKRHPGVEGIIVYEERDSLKVDLSPGFEAKFIPSSDHDQG